MSLSGFSSVYGFPDIDIDSDDSIDDNTSSEDEIDIILHGTPEQRRKLKHIHNKEQSKKARLQHQQRSIRNGSDSSCEDEFDEEMNGKLHKQRKESDSSSEDEFEKQMNAELDKQVAVLEHARGNTSDLAVAGSKPSNSLAVAPQETKSSSKKTAKKEDEFYDEIYFDSDEEDEGSNASTSRSKGKPKHPVISNDDLLYDPDMDDEDQKWVDQQRSSHRPPSQSNRRGKKGKVAKMPNSDALLDCPACMTTLCIDCQRHETYKHQYRAMFVMNCEVDTSESLECPEQETKRSRKKKKNQQNSENSDPTGASLSTDLFNPVRCTECRTVVAVIDSDELYHFFNVLASHT